MTTCENITVYPIFFLRLLTLNWHFQSPFILYSFFCIIFLSPNAMSNFKWHLIVCQLTSTFLDFTFSMGFTPIVIPAMMFGWSAGYYRNIMTCQGMVTLSVICMTYSGFSNVEVFCYRYQNLLLPSSKAKLKVQTYYTIWVVVIIIFAVIIYVMHCLLDSDQNEQRLKWSKIYSCADFLFDLPASFSCDRPKYLNIVIYGIITAFSCAVIIAFSLFHSLRVINSLQNSRSNVNRRSQKRLFFLLCAQIFFPFFCYLLAGSIIIFSLSFQVEQMQEAFNVAVLIFTNYGFASSLSIVYCNDPYRKFTQRLFLCEFKDKSNTNVMIISDKSAMFSSLPKNMSPRYTNVI